MANDGDGWIRVESEAELRPQMAVWLRPCPRCGRGEVHLIVREVESWPVSVLPDGSKTSTPAGARGWSTVGRCTPWDGRHDTYWRIIADGKLYRLALPDATDTTSEAERAGELPGQVSHEKLRGALEGCVIKPRSKARYRDLRSMIERYIRERSDVEAALRVEVAALSDEQHRLNRACEALVDQRDASTELYQEARAEVERLRAEVDRFRSALDRDKTGLAAALDECRKIARGYRWICEGRGPYTYDDDRYREETQNLINAVCAAAAKGLGDSGDLATAVIRDGASVTAQPTPASPSGMRKRAPLVHGECSNGKSCRDPDHDHSETRIIAVCFFDDLRNAPLHDGRLVE